MADVKNVTASKPAVAGAVRRAPLGTKLPTTADETLDAAFVSLGYISEDGYTNSNTMKVSSTKAWGGDTVLNGETGKPDTFKIKFLESLNPDVLKAVYGDENVTGTLAAGITVHANSKEQKPYVWVIDEIMKDGVKSRTVIGNGTVTNIADIVHKDGEPLGYELTVDAVPCSDTNNDTHVTYIKKA